MKNAHLLQEVLDAALQQVVSGKGMERHGGEDLLTQPWRWISDAAGEGFLMGQALKKTQEATRMPADRFEREVLGAIAYLAFAVLKRRLDSSNPIVLPEVDCYVVVNGQTVKIDKETSGGS